MSELRSIFAELGLHEVRTYIQSGNIVFRADTDTATDTVRGSDEIAVSVSRAVERKKGFAPSVLVLSAAKWREALQRNPFTVTDPKTLHLYFLSAPPRPDMTGLDAARAPDEQFHLIEDVFYLFAPSGIGRSKLAANVERLLGAPGTGRNWRTVSKITEMLAVSDNG